MARFQPREFWPLSSRPSSVTRMDMVKGLLVFFILTGCAEVASELPLTRTALGPQTPTLEVAPRLGPPSALGAGARHVDHAAAKTALAAVY
jgi:hypothetical protein